MPTLNRLLAVILALHSVASRAAADEVDYPPPPFDRVGEYTLTIGPDGDPADVYHPDPEDLLDGDYSFPVAVFLQGFNVDKQNYSRYARIVASYGFVVVVPNNPRRVGGRTVLTPAATQIDKVAEQMQIENDDPESPLFDAIDAERLVLLGHSAGGAECLAVCVRACELNPGRPYAVLAGAFYAAGWRFAVEDGPIRPIGADEPCAVPTMMLQGTRDSIHRPAQSLDVYRRLRTLPKTLVFVDGANHYGVANENNPPHAPPDHKPPTLDQDQAIETVGAWHGLFLRAAVYEDVAAQEFVYAVGDALDPNVRVMQETAAP
jgi:pimeloyl-ACP methyl ester carboxylesterase